ncbi:hypothetical protein IE53DRAFT_389626 [Violaceomyces palustris]|uniref:Uncharacterized protein n=1 Tax=Violaceomyces palustris TaxID=1673888 RepID=A0ACD0NQZ0_9BASI|nr:hypothetical protein IE53DRAFT_389626 [Violaceomyces palustris]
MGISHSRITLESVTSPPLESRPGSPPIWTKIGIYDEYTCTPTPRFLKIKIESTFGGGLLIVDGISGQSLFSAKNAALFSRKYELFDVSGKKIYKLDGVRHTMLKSPDPVGEGTLPKSLGQIVDESTFDIFSRGRIEIVNRLSGANEVVVLRVRKDETIEVRGVSGQLLAKFGQRFLIRGQEIECELVFSLSRSF